MTHKEILKNRINYYVSKIIEIQKNIDWMKNKKIYAGQYSKSLEQYKSNINEILDELIKE